MNAEYIQEPERTLPVRYADYDVIVAGGGIAAPESSEQKKYGIEDTCEAYVDLWVEYNHNEYFREDSGMDEDRIRFVVGQAAGLIDWRRTASSSAVR